MTPQEVIAALKIALCRQSWDTIEATILHLEEWAGPIDLDEMIAAQAQQIADELGYEVFDEVLLLPWTGKPATDMGD